MTDFHSRNDDGPPPNETPLWAQLTDPRTLRGAWRRVRRNGGAAGGDAETIGMFERQAEAKLARLRRDLLGGTYAPGPHRVVEIPKASGGARVLSIPCVVDRVTQTAAHEILGPVLEPEFEETSYAYRPGRSVRMAVARAAALRRAGYRWAVDADIERFFASVPHDRLLDRLAGHVDEAPLLALIELWLDAAAGGGRGLPQGGPISPLLANLYLDEVDEAMEGAGVRLLRYADDILLLCRDEAAAEGGLARLDELLRAHGLVLNRDKTEIVPFDGALRWLGHLFVRSMVLASPSDDATPPAVDEAPASHAQEPTEAEVTAAEAFEAAGDPRAGGPEPAAPPDAPVDDHYGLLETERHPGLRVLYLTRPRLSLDVRNEAFSVVGDGAEVLALHNTRVDRIEIGPRAGAGADALRLAVASDTQLVWTDGHGRAVGSLAAERGQRARLHLDQAACALDPARALDLARRIVRGRLRTQRAQLFRLNRPNKSADDGRYPLQSVRDRVDRISGYLKQLPQAAGLDAVRGYEGAATAECWRALDELLAAGDADGGGAWRLPRRERPGSNPVNIVLNYLAWMLARDIEAAVLRAGLHPGFGMLHAARDDGDACVYDLMEPFRAALVEGLCVFLFNRGDFTADHFLPDADQGDGWRMLPAGGRIVIRGYEARVARSLKSKRSGRRLTWRRLMQEEAFAYRAHALGETEYMPFEMDY